MANLATKNEPLTRGEIVAAFKAHGWCAGLPVPVPRRLLRKLPDDFLKMFEWFGHGRLRG